jgi:hypothetical protein
MTDPAAWQRLRDHLVASGAMHPNGTTRRAQPRRCRTCNAHVITGLDSDLTALAVIADPTPLDAIGEVLAIATARPTYTLEHDGPRLVLNYRDPGRIQHRPPGGARYDVLPDHVCGRQLPAVRSNTLTAARIAALPAGSPAPF